MSIRVDRGGGPRKVMGWHAGAFFFKGRMKMSRHPSMAKLVGGVFLIALALSGTAWAQVQAPVLSAPANGSVSTSGAVIFDWADVASATRYEILIDNNPDFGSPEVRTQVSPLDANTPPLSEFWQFMKNVFGFANLQPGTTYYWRVRAACFSGDMNGACNTGYGAWSEEWSFTTPATPIVDVAVVFQKPDGTQTCPLQIFLKRPGMLASVSAMAFAHSSAGTMSKAEFFLRTGDKVFAVNTDATVSFDVSGNPIFETSWKVPQGFYTLSARAYDSMGNLGWSWRECTVAVGMK